MDKSTALILVDIQKGLDAPQLGERNNPDAEANCLAVLADWRANGRPIIHVQHNSVEPSSTLRPEHPGNAFKEGFEPLEGELHLTKSVNSAFIGTGLADHLRQAGISDIVVCGLTTNHCVSTTVRMGGNLGFNVTLVGDGTAAHSRTDHNGKWHSAEVIHEVALASLHGEFATVVNTADLLQPE